MVLFHLGIVRMKRMPVQQVVDVFSFEVFANTLGEGFVEDGVLASQPVNDRLDEWG